ncbi:hypothetical protein MYX64_02845 [Nitrospinae bacterium AH_259_B05_G02_I21]|nr:hypothetical protein [Nitrospinae bacterium AH_259_B05_G02_I21]
MTTTRTFTRTSAQYIASKVVSDLRRMLSYYGKPSESWIDAYYEELSELLANGYVENVEYGFKRNGKRVVSLYYAVRADGSLSDNRAGGVYAWTDTAGAAWFSFLNYTNKWWRLSQEERNRFRSRLPFRRTVGEAPGDGYGYWITDRSYTADGVGTQRRTFRPY